MSHSRRLRLEAEHAVRKLRLPYRTVLRRQLPPDPYAKAVVDRVKERLLEFTQVDIVSATEVILPPKQRTLRHDMKTAAHFRKKVTENMPSVVCACCNQYRRKCTVEAVLWEDIPHLELLLADGPKTPDAPRDALTTYSSVQMKHP